MNTTYIYDELSGRYEVVSIEEAHAILGGKGGSIGSRCIECGGPTSARFHPDREWHFMHHPRQPCLGEAATDLHERVAEIVMRASVLGRPIACPGEISLSVSQACAELSHGRIRPDVTIMLDDKNDDRMGRMVWIEITYTHPTGPVKRQILEREGVPTLEIDVQSLYGRDIEDIDLERIVLEEINRKSWIVDPFRKPPSPRSRSVGEVLRALYEKVRSFFILPEEHAAWLGRVLEGQPVLPLVGGKGEAPLHRPKTRKKVRGPRPVQLKLDLFAM